MTTQEKNKTFAGISSFTLHILAMAFMLCDHLWATIIPGNAWLTWLGRLAYPLFAFMIVEGFCHTSNLKKYMRRILIFAVVSEIPFNLMTADSLIWPFQQNVMWTFLLALFCLKKMDQVRKTRKPVTAALLCAVIMILGSLAALLTMVDYLAYGVITVFVFYWFRGKKWWQRLGQLAGLVVINVYLISGLMIPVTLFGRTFEISQQSAAVLAILPIWLYNGKRGLDNRWIQYGFYSFYPVHMLILALLRMV